MLSIKRFWHSRPSMGQSFSIPRCHGNDLYDLFLHAH